MKIFFRGMMRRKAVNLINIAGLVLAITGAVLIFEYVFYERSYENHIRHADDIYRVSYDRYREGTLLWETANSFHPVGGWLQSNIPEVEDYFNLAWYHNVEISAKESLGAIESFFENNTYFATNSIFYNLDIHLIAGADSCLVAPYTAVISERLAKKLFKDRDPVGQMITVNSSDQYAVTGVYRNIPHNTHIKSDIFFSIATMYIKNPQLRTSWGNDNTHTYIRLKTGTDYKAVEEKAFPKIAEDNYGNTLISRSIYDDYYLQPLKSIHLYSNIEYELDPPGNGKGVDLLFAFSIFLLIVAWINYVNLVTACSVDRAKEVGVKKVCGSKRKNLIGQFIGEAVIFNIVCIILSVGLVFLATPFFKQLTGIEQLYAIFNTKFLSFSLLFILSGILLSSLYPAFVLSSHQPMEVLKGRFKNSAQGVFLRKILITFQLMVSLSLLIGAIIVNKQVKYLIQKDLGYTYQSVLVIRAPYTTDEPAAYTQKIEVLADNLRRYPDITDFTFVSDIPGQEIINWAGGYLYGSDPSTSAAHFRVDIDPEFVDFFQIKLLAGRNFTEEDRVSLDKYLVNVQAMERLGLTSPEEAIGKKVIARNTEQEIIGVLDDTNYKSVKVEAVPTFFTLNDGVKRFIAVKYLGTANPQSIIDKIKPEYDALFLGHTFDYEFLEDKIANDTKPDRISSLVFGVFSGLAAVISVIGILGLVMIIINQNMKSLGVRKILGASLLNVNVFLWKHFIYQLLIAICIAVPVSYYIFQTKVLENYIYRITISPGHLIFPVLLIAAVLALVIFLLARKAFSINVSQILKLE